MTENDTAPAAVPEATPSDLPIPTKANVLAYLADARAYQAEQARQAAIRWGRRYGVDPGTKPRTLSQWAMGLIRECPHKYLLAQVLKIRPRLRKSSLAFGTAVDEGVTARLRPHGNLRTAQDAFLASWDKQVEEAGGLMQLPKDWDLGDFRLSGLALLNSAEPVLDEIRPLALAKWMPWSPILDPLTGAAMPGFVLSGKLDIIDLVQLEGMEEPRACITDTKALATLTSPEDWYLNTRLALQLVGYAYGSTQDETLADLPGIGTMVGYLEAQRKKPPAAPKLKKDGTPSKAKQADPPKVQRTFADVGPEEFAELLVFASTLARQILGYAEREAQGLPVDVAWPRNMAACGRDAYGQACDYRPLCRAHLYAEHPGLDALYTYEYEPRSEF